MKTNVIKHLMKINVIKHLISLKILNMMDINADLFQWLINFLIKVSVANTSGGAVKGEIMPNQEPAEELHKPIIRNFEKRKVHSSFISNFWDADIVNMRLISKFNKGIRFLLCVIDILSK